MSVKLEAKGTYINKVLGKDQRKNLDVFIQVLKDGGITNPIFIAAACAIASKESAFVMQRENMKYSAEGLQKTFGLDATKANQLAKNEQGIANWVYGAQPHGRGVPLGKGKGYGPGPYGGNTGPYDGFLYRGGGLNGITFKGGFEKASKAAGVDLVKDPDKISNVVVASKVALAYYQRAFDSVKKNYSVSNLNDFKDLETAVICVYHMTAGVNYPLSKFKALLNPAADSLGGMTKAQHRKEEFLAHVKAFTGLKEPLGALLAAGPSSNPVPDAQAEVATQQTVQAPSLPPPPPPPPDPRADGFLKLEKVSGPGEMMGETEAEVIFGETIFKGLQFDKDGDYVIKAYHTFEGVEPLEFLVKVALNENPPSQEKPKVEEETGKRPIITQIDPPTYVLPPIEMPVPPDANKTANAEELRHIGLTPFIWYNGYQIKENDIYYLVLYYKGMVPAVEVNFIDSAAILKKVGFPGSDSTFDVFMNSGSKVLKSIHLRMKIDNFQENANKSYTMTGTLDLRDFYKVNYKSWTGTSFEVLREMSSELNLGYNSNIDQTTDSMKWINTGMTWREFIGDVVSHSYISDDAFTLAYIDFYYCLNYVDLEKEWSRNVSTDVGISSTGITQVDGKQTEKDTTLPLVLMNEKSQNMVNTYFQNYSVQNNATNKAISSGQFTISKYYDTASKQFLIFNVDSLTSKDDSKVILKGKPADASELQTNYTTVFGGRVDLSNVHKNYLYADVLNSRNLTDLSKIVVTLEIPQCNFNLYKFQKIRIQFINEAPTIAEEDLNQVRISGEWMIVDIKFSWQATGAKGTTVQTVTAVRKELEKLPEEKTTTTTKTEEVVKEGNQNELAPETPPNIIYKVDEIYIVEDKDGRTYEFTVTEVLENGVEIKGWLYED
jgi:predicted chitinase